MTTRLSSLSKCTSKVCFTRLSSLSKCTSKVLCTEFSLLICEYPLCEFLRCKYRLSISITSGSTKSHSLVKSSLSKKHKSDFEERVIVVHKTNKYIYISNIDIRRCGMSANQTILHLIQAKYTSCTLRASSHEVPRAIRLTIL